MYFRRGTRNIKSRNEMSCNEHAFSLAQNSPSLSNELSDASGADGAAGKSMLNSEIFH